MTREDQAARFAKRFRHELQGRALNAHALAHQMEPKDHKKAESLRVQMQKWLSGTHVPSIKNRKRLAKALGLPEDALDGDEELSAEDELALSLALAFAPAIRDYRERTHREHVERSKIKLENDKPGGGSSASEPEAAADGVMRTVPAPSTPAKHVARTKT